MGFGRFRHIFPGQKFYQSLKNPPTQSQIMGFQGGGDHHILPEVSYVLEKTFEAVDGGL